MAEAHHVNNANLEIYRGVGSQPMKKKKSHRNWLERSLEPEPETPPVEDKTEPLILQPALRQIGTTDCPICKHKVAVFLTKTHRPFANRGLCSARIFYNGRESIRRLNRTMREVGE